MFRITWCSLVILAPFSVAAANVTSQPEPVATATSRPDFPDAWTRSFTAAQAQAKARLIELKAELDAIVRQARSRRDAGKYNQLYAEAKARIARLQATGGGLPDLTAAMQVGDVGLTEHFIVRQIVGRDQMRVDIVTGHRVVKRGHPVVTEPVYGDVWLEGLDTAGLVDGQRCEGIMLAVVGTKTYKTTSGGSHTVFVVRPGDVDKWRSAYDWWRSQAANQR